MINIFNKIFAIVLVLSMVAGFIPVAAAGNKIDSVSGFVNTAITKVTGRATIEFDVTASQITDGFIGIGSSYGNPAYYNGYAICFRLTNSGVFDSVNGANFEATEEAIYEAGKTYHVTIDADVKNQVFDIFVNDGNNTYTVANCFSFRTEATDLAVITATPGYQVEAGHFYIENVTVTETAGEMEFLKLPNFFTDDMVIQRDEPHKIFGRTNSDEVVVTLTDGIVTSTKTVKVTNGEFMATLEPLSASLKPYKLTVSTDEREVVIDKVFVGDVFFLAGQSNMEQNYVIQISVEMGDGVTTSNIPQMYVDDRIKHFTLAKQSSNVETFDVPFTYYNGWRALNEDNKGDLSYIGMFFAEQRLKEEPNVPIGLMVTSWGGSAINSWMRVSDDNKTPNYTPSNGGIYNSHVAPLVNYPIKAVMWYQGESDSGRHVSYAEIFQRMIADWRELWGKEDLPFFYVQLARYSRDNYAPIRNAQLQTLKLPNTGMVVTLDTDEGTYKNIHPLGKDVIGERMALLADKIIYGKDIVASGPIFKNAEVKGNKIIVHFEEDTIGDGLCISNTYGATDTKLCEFEIADVTGSYVKANAVINSDNTITVSADSITNPKYVRYAYSAVPANPNLFNKNGLPASPFTNDNRIVSANSFSSRAYETVGGDKQKISFDLTPIKDNIDGVIGITAAENSISAWNSAGITIRFQYDGYMGYVNDTVFENTTLAYKAGETYAVEIIADFSSDTYSLYVDGKLLCDGAKFRWDSLDMSNLGRIMLRGGSGWAAGDFYAENVNISRVANISQDEPKSFMDCFDPMPIVGNLSSDCWGSDLVGPRDQSNGLEDRTMESYNYWDGGIIKDEKTNKYHMFTSRWDQSTGFNGWKKSVAVHSVSDSLYGPYVEQEGLLWPDNKSGAGHNVFPFKLRDGDPNGKYAIINSDNGRPGDIFVADSLDGPWKYCTSITSNMKGSGFNAINVAVFLRPDGKYQALARHGDVAIADNLKGPWTVVIDCLWDQVPGLPYTDSDGGHRLEDPTMWYSNGKYHIIVNHWNMRKAYYMTSDDGITNWKLHSGSAYEPDADFLRYTDGTINHWNKIERPYAYVENGELKAFTFAVVDTAKEKDYANDLHGSKVIVVPFNSKKLDKIIAEDTIYHKRDGIAPVADGNVQSWESEAEYNYGGNPYMNLQVNNSDASYGIMGENSVGGTSDDCKISYVKYDISDYDLNKVFKATLSVVYKERLVGASDEDSIQVTLAGNDWEEGDGSDILGKAAESGELTWSAKPEIIYDAEDVEATVAYSDVFDTTENYQIIDIDVTSLIKNVDKNSDTVAFALCNTVNGNRLAVYTKELGTAYSVQLNLFEEDSYEGDNTDYDRLHLILDTEGREESGKLKDKTNNDKSAWYNWVTDSDNVTVDNGLNFDGNVTATVTRNDCRANKLVIEFTPDGTPAYPDHGILDGEGKVLFAHRYATDDNRIHIGRGEINSNVRGDDYIKDKSEQSRLTNFVAEKLGAFSARVDRGTVRYYQGDRVRIVAENTYWDDSLKKLFTDSENYTESFADMQEGEEVYTVTYYILQDGYTFKVSDSLYKGNFNGFGGFLVSGGKSGAIVSYKEIKIYTDNAEPKVFCENFKIKSEGVEGSNVAVFVAKEGDILKEVYTEETTDDFEIAIPEGYEYATFMLLNDIDKLSPVIKSFGIDANSVFVSAVGQNVKAFLPVENRTESAVYTFQFKDNGSNDSGIIIGSDEAGLNSQSSNYFASGSIVILFSNGELYTRDADSKALRGAYTVGEEVDVQIEADIAANTYNLYINGELVAENVGFRKSATVLDTLCLVENKGGEAFEVYNFRVR